MAAATKFQPFSEALAEKKHNLGADTLKLVLSLVAPLVTNAVLSDITQIANGNGYTTGGAQSTQSSSAQSSGLYKLVSGDVTWVAVTGSIGPFRYATLYNDSATNDDLVLFWDHGVEITIQAGNSWTQDFSDVNGVLQLQ